MEALEHLRSILNFMGSNERTVLRNYLTCFESRKKGFKPKTLILYDLLEKYQDDQKVEALLKKKIPSADARRMVVGRLREKMLASLVLDVNLSREENYDEQGQAVASVILGKLHSKLLLSRGQRKSGFYVLERTIKKAKYYELYDDLVDMLVIQRQHIRALTEKKEAFYQVVEEIAHYSACRDAVNLAKQYFEEINIHYGFEGLSRIPVNSLRLKFLKERVEQLQEAYEKTGSASVGYYYYFLLVESFQLQNDLDQAAEALFSLVKLLEENPSIKRTVRLANVYLNIGVNEMWRHRFTEADQQFNISLRYVRKNTRNHALLIEQMFYSSFYAGEIDRAEEQMQSLLDSKLVDQSDYRRAVRNYLLACVAFAKGEFRKVNLKLASTTHIGKDKEGWNIGVRTLSIMLAIEREKFDLADAQIISFRQFLREGLKDRDVRKRDLLIVEILVELRAKSYDFQKVAEAKKETLSELFTDNFETGWQVQTPEMICFHTWFYDKLNGRPYQCNYSRPYLYGQLQAH